MHWDSGLVCVAVGGTVRSAWAETVGGSRVSEDAGTLRRVESSPRATSARLPGPEMGMLETVEVAG